jgi:hypothetical protein
MTLLHLHFLMQQFSAYITCSFSISQVFEFLWFEFWSSSANFIKSKYFIFGAKVKLNPVNEDLLFSFKYFLLSIYCRCLTSLFKYFQELILVLILEYVFEKLFIFRFQKTPLKSYSWVKKRNFGNNYNINTYIMFYQLYILSHLLKHLFSHDLWYYLLRFSYSLKML